MKLAIKKDGNYKIFSFIVANDLNISAPYNNIIIYYDMKFNTIVSTRISNTRLKKGYKWIDFDQQIFELACKCCFDNIFNDNKLSNNQYHIRRLISLGSEV